MPITMIDGKAIARGIKEKVGHDIQKITSTYAIIPTIATIMVGKNKESSLYLRLRDKACEQVNIQSHHVLLPENIAKKKLIKTIEQLNDDESIHGILIQLPLPPHLSIQQVFKALSPDKDVEGFHPYNLGRLIDGNEEIIPCTPKAVLEILRHVNMKIQGKHVVIVNHSMVVGKPLSILCLNRNATVSVCHVYTPSLVEHTSKADVLVSAAGVPNLITNQHVKDDFCLIDVGIIQTEQGIQGDVDVTSIKNKSGMLTPVPGGVGPVTVACSLQNMVQTITRCIEV